MSNQFYGKALEGFAGADIDWDADSIRCLLVRTTGTGSGPYYAPSIDADEFLDDIPNNIDCRPATAEILGSKTKALGVLDAGDLAFPTMAAGDAIQLLVIYQHTGTEATSRLIAKIDTATGLPITPTGVDVNVKWSSGANRIARI